MNTCKSIVCKREGDQYAKKKNYNKPLIQFEKLLKKGQTKIYKKIHLKKLKSGHGDENCVSL